MPDKCWCGHSEKGHKDSGICMWCARRELSWGINFPSWHPFDSTPEGYAQKQREWDEATIEALRDEREH